MAAGRAKVRERHDHRAPTLFLRLKGGCLWYVPGFAVGGGGLQAEQWDSLIDYIREGQCTPILGFGLLEPFVGESRAIARAWAEANNFPMVPSRREALPQVAQCLAVMTGDDYPQRALRNEIDGQFRARFKLGELPPKTPLEDVFREAARRAPEAMRSFEILAGLPLPMYLTTTPDSLLLDALKSAPSKNPEREYAQWNTLAKWPRPIDQRDPDYEHNVRLT
jgi:hypothetical protein